MYSTVKCVCVCLTSHARLPAQNTGALADAIIISSITPPRNVRPKWCLDSFGDVIIIDQGPFYIYSKDLSRIIMD